MRIKKFDYTDTKEDIFNQVIYPLYAREFLFDSSFEYFKKRVSTNFILSEAQWSYIQSHWEDKEKRIQKDMEKINKTEDEILDSITIKMLEDMDNGDEIQLSDEYKLYMYCEEDIYVVIKVDAEDEDNEEEIYQVLYNEENDEIVFESLT